jgi:hypothetical protein
MTEPWVKLVIQVTEWFALKYTAMYVVRIRAMYFPMALNRLASVIVSILHLFA